MDTTKSEQKYTEKDLREAFFNGGMEINTQVDMSSTAWGIEKFNDWLNKYKRRVINER